MDFLNLTGLEWDKATKTKNLIARPLCTILTDDSITSKFMLRTLEGMQELKDDSMVCVGIGNDIWQQSKKALLGKYDVTDFTTDGWMVCTPKPGNEVECYEVDSSLVDSVDNTFKIIAQWGLPTGDGTFMQTGKSGDFICRNPLDIRDVWIVERTMFLNTYETLSENKSREELNAPSAKVIPLFKKVA